MDKIINNKKTARIIAAVLAGLIVLLGVFMLITLDKEKGEASAKSKADTETAVEEESVKKLSIINTAEYAEDMYSCRVTDINDSASVALLLETMGMEDIAGKYTVEIAPSDAGEILTLTAEKTVKAEMTRAYDDNMMICAHQILALIPEVDQVTWKYKIAGADGKEEAVSGSVNAEEATASEGKDIRSYGESQNAFEELVKEQMKK